jgi:transcriptional regulator with PAS, ATPase and Fis domain
VEEGRFREDLYYRLRVVEIPIPPLRERRSDVPALAHHFLDITNKKMGRSLRGFSNAVMDIFTAHEWSGNVRELENEIQRAVALAGDEDTVHSDMLSEHLRGGGDDASSSGIEIPRGPNLNKAVDALKRAMILDAMRESGSKTRAAERLGIPRQSLQKMMKRLEID